MYIFTPAQLKNVSNGIIATAQNNPRILSFWLIKQKIDCKQFQLKIKNGQKSLKMYIFTPCSAEKCFKRCNGNDTL